MTECSPGTLIFMDSRPEDLSRVGIYRMHTRPIWKFVFAAVRHIADWDQYLVANRSHAKVDTALDATSTYLGLPNKFSAFWV